MKARAIVFTGQHQVALDSVAIPEPGPGEAIVQAGYTCISPGTELRCLAGTLAEARPYPFIPGYSLAGTVISRGRDCRFREGQRVWCTGTARASVDLTWGGHTSHALAHEQDLVAIPDNVSLRDASLGRLAAIAYHGVRISAPLPHEKVALVGLGPIGMLSAVFHAASGAEVVVADRVEARVAVARQLGFAGFVASDGLAEGFARRFAQGADILVDATGLPNIAGQLIPAGRDLPWDDSPSPCAARYLIQGSCDTDYVFPQIAAFDRELRFLLSRDRQPRDVVAVFDLLSRGAVRVADIISEVRDPEVAPQTYTDLRQKRGNLLTVAFQWSRP
jgi:2-desacetyl-2-hydroxyethyl bacteriochlorophyllide A dehydrogenase